MTKHLLAMLVLIAGTPIYAADTTMTCQGVSRTYGHNAPKRITFDENYSSSGDMLVIADDRKWAAGLLLNTDTKLSLCRETSTELLYSFDCSADPKAFISDWLSMHSQDEGSGPMTKKYGEHWSDFETLRVSRVNLTVTATYLVAEVARDFVKPKDSSSFSPADVTQTLYIRATEYRGTCKVTKSKI